MSLAGEELIQLAKNGQSPLTQSNSEIESEFLTSREKKVQIKRHSPSADKQTVTAADPPLLKYHGDSSVMTTPRDMNHMISEICSGYVKQNGCT